MGTPYHSLKLHLDPCSSVGKQRGTDTQAAVVTIQFAWLCLMQNGYMHECLCVLNREKVWPLSTTACWGRMSRAVHQWQSLSWWAEMLRQWLQQNVRRSRFALYLARIFSSLQLLKPGTFFLQLFECVPVMIFSVINSRPTPSSRPSNPLSASLLVLTRL